MAKNSTTAPATPEITPTAPDPASELTGTLARIHQQLHTQPGATVTALAVALGVGRSTIGKALTALEQRQLAVRQPGAPTNGRRNADRWSAASHAAPAQSETTAREQTADTEQPCVPEPCTGSVTEVSPDTDTGDNPTPVAAAAETDGEQETSAATAEQMGTRRQRLRPGALREMVLEHLQAHPSEAFTATKISRVVEKSSGAIANALVTLTQQGLAEQVDERPRTYRATAPTQQ